MSGKRGRLVQWSGYAFCAKMLTTAPFTVASDRTVPVQRTEKAELGKTIGSGPQWYQWKDGA